MGEVFNAALRLCCKTIDSNEFYQYQINTSKGKHYCFATDDIKIQVERSIKIAEKHDWQCQFVKQSTFSGNGYGYEIYIKYISNNNRASVSKYANLIQDFNRTIPDCYKKRIIFVPVPVEED